MIRHCLSCGHRVSETARFCTACGGHTWKQLASGGAGPFQPGYEVPTETASPATPAALSRRSFQQPPSVRDVPGPSPVLAGERRIEATFTLLEERGPEAILECPRCGYEFEVNAYTGENLVIDCLRGRQLAVCPLCGTLEA
jgi:hypothetical protein